MLLELTDLTVMYGSAEVLKGISMIIPEKSIVCLIGANGAGKTTTLRTISGLIKPVSGSIHFQGQKITGCPPRSILKSGVVHAPQEGKIFKDMNVKENLMMGAYLRSDKPAIEQDLEHVYEYFPILKQRTNQLGGNLSGGERQMLAIGRAFMSKPVLLMMDEPTFGLAPMVVQMIKEIIPRLNQDGIGILLVEQNAEMALLTADYGYVLERGAIALHGPTKDLHSNNEVKTAYLGL